MPQDRSTYKFSVWYKNKSNKIHFLDDFTVEAPSQREAQIAVLKNIRAGIVIEEIHNIVTALKTEKVLL